MKKISKSIIIVSTFIFVVVLTKLTLAQTSITGTNTILYNAVPGVTSGTTSPITEVYSTTTSTSTTVNNEGTFIRNQIIIEPQAPIVVVGKSISFKATANGSTLSNVKWTILEEAGGIINDYGVYTAPSVAGIFTIIATDPLGILQAAKTTVFVRLAEAAIYNSITPTAPATTTTGVPVVPLYQNTIPSTVPLPISTTKPPSGSVTNIADVVLPAQHIKRETEPTPKVSDIPSTTNSPGSSTAIPGISSGIAKPIVQPETTIINNTETVLTTVQKFQSIVDIVPATDIASAFKAQGGELLYKDTNNDGISDYESVTVYNLDPIKPSPVSIVDGKTITAGDKVLIGLDPTSSAPQKIIHEEPMASSLPHTDAYKVESVNLSTDKKLSIAGKALPNSYITIYIYSTPTIVTVKTDDNGDWQYTLDKELDNGTHEIYTATVSNSGKILAKSKSYLFIQTAEAATLEEVESAPISTTDTKPGVFTNRLIIIIMGIGLLVVAAILVFSGSSVKKDTESLGDTEINKL